LVHETYVLYPCLDESFKTKQGDLMFYRYQMRGNKRQTLFVFTTASLYIGTI